jgi:hypothetical protein
MAEYCSKMTEYSSKMTERCITVSKCKITEYRGDGGLGTAAREIGGLINVGSAHRSTQDKSGAHAGRWGARRRVGQWGTRATRGWLV